MIYYLIGHNIPNTTNDLQPQTALLLLIFIFGVAASFLGFVYSSFPDMSETESSYVKFPKVGVTIHHNILDLSFKYYYSSSSSSKISYYYSCL